MLNFVLLLPMLKTCLLHNQHRLIFQAVNCTCRLDMPCRRELQQQKTCQEGKVYIHQQLPQNIRLLRSFDMLLL